MLCWRYSLMTSSFVLVVLTSKRLVLAHETGNPTEVITQSFVDDRWIELCHVVSLFLCIINIQFFSNL